MQETQLTPEQQNYAATANSSARTLLSIVDEALDTAKGQTSGQQQSGPITIRPLVENVTELLSARAHAKALELSAYVAADVPAQIVARDLALRQILFNLVGNAIKFTETGGIGISLVVRDQALVFEIEDTGIGMTPGEWRGSLRNISKPTLKHRNVSAARGLVSASRATLSPRWAERFQSEVRQAVAPFLQWRCHNLIREPVTSSGPAWRDGACGWPQNRF